MRLGDRQLAAWQAIARDWEWRGWGRLALCDVCEKSIALICDSQDRPYAYSDDQWLALIVLHLRNHHPDLDPDQPLKPL